ncbi:MAG: phage antirepressor N-terminal domain-containing protein [Desulfobulbaceae bacterium]|nr:phage antirepressor N-terminal domain-containing protein [Desulfobulbaceae bacterium]
MSAQAKQLEPVPFHGDTIFAVDHNGEPFAPVRPIIENMGLNWASQYVKLQNNNDRWGVVIITTPSAGGIQETICIPIRKVAGFLATINHKKVRPELREKILSYQNECDDALWQYWTTGRAERMQYAGGAALPSPGLSMDAISALCREADKYLKGKASLRALHFFTGMPVADLLEEIESPDPAASDVAATLSQYLSLLLPSPPNGCGLETGTGPDGQWLQGTTAQFFGAFIAAGRAPRLPLIFRNPKHLGTLFSRESESLAFLGWRREPCRKIAHGYRYHRFVRFADMAEGGEA